ncbi:MAG: SDR family oxidoreductase, partial [Deltaproteobacteria bacterium]|nr:SDR family oxidoreductase [Deltaproteobacteria bacterium]
MSSLFDLHGRTAIVTGGSRGIGRAISERLAEHGARVVVASRKLPACEEVAAGIRERGGEALALACNISERAELERLVAGTRSAYGAIDVLVCNAAVNPYYGPTQDIPDAAFDKVLAVNVRSNHWLCQLVIPEMAARRDGSVIIVSSIAGLRGTATLGAYAVSKAADLQLARNLAVEWGPSNVRVNCIAPGLVRTDFARALWEDPATYARAVSTYPLRRI